MAKTQHPQETSVEDFGLGSGQIDTRHRLLNRDGSFNVSRACRWTDRLSYLGMLDMRWRDFFLSLAGIYMASNLIFALAYLLCGPGALATNGPDSGVLPVWRALFFSVQTLSTIGYGSLVPIGMAANCIVAVESIYGLLMYALITGLFFSRFSRIRPQIRFSRCAVVTEWKGLPTLFIRLTNTSRSELIDLSARVLYSRFEGDKSSAVRRFVSLAAEPQSVAFLPLAWTLTHQFTEESPLKGMGFAELAANRTEIFVLITGVDASSGQTVNARTSYCVEDLQIGKRFADILVRDTEGNVNGINLARFDDVL